MSSVFFLIPLVLLGLAIGAPFAMFLWGKFRETRAERVYARTPRTMPPLPRPHRSAEPECERSLAP